MDLSRIHCRWSRPLRNVSKKRKKTGLMNYAKRKNKEIVFKVEPGESLIASEFNSELNSEGMPVHNNDANSTEISSSLERPVNVNEEIASRAIVKEEIVIKDEVCDQSMFDTNELNITSDFSLLESNPGFNDAQSNATSEFDNIRIGIDESLIGKHVKGIFSSETIGSKTLTVFRRLPGEPEIIVPKVVNDKKSVSSKREQADKLYKNNFSSKKIRFLSEQKKAILKGKYTRFCSNCKIPLGLDSTDNCTLCAAKSFYSCKQCNDTFDSYFKLSRHIFMRCISQGYYHCPKCFYKSRCFNIVRKHILLMHPHLGLDFDLRSIEWKDIDKDENGAALLMHICQSCGRAFQRLPNYNIHTGICHKMRPGLKSISTNDDSRSHEDENSSPQKDDGRKKIMLHCEKCNKDTKLYHFLNCQPNCIICQTKMKFKCTLCNKLLDKDSWAVKHLKLTCISRQQIKCRFCGKNVLYKRNLLRHEKRHLKIANRQVESPSKKIILDEAGKVPDSNKNKVNSNKSTMSTCEEEKRSAKFSSNPDLTKQSIESQRSSHSKMSKLQVVVSPLKNKSLVGQAKNFSENRKNAKLHSSEKNTKSTREKEKRSYKCFSSQKSDAKFSSNPDSKRQSKYFVKFCEKKQQMQCKVLLTRLRINKS